MTITITDEFREKVDKAARSVASGNGRVEWEDVAQDIWVRLLENVMYYHEVAGYDEPFPALKKIAKQEIYKQNNAYEHFTGNYRYSPKEVRAILSEYLVRVELDRIAEHVDVVEGLLMLKESNPSYFKVIIDKFVHGIEPPNSSISTRAVDKLTQLMNKVNQSARYYYEGVGARRIVSNAQAQALTANHSESGVRINNKKGENWN